MVQCYITMQYWLSHTIIMLVGNVFHSWLLLIFSFVFVVPPVISSRGGTVTVVVNEAARLECEATGVPMPSLTWLKDGSPVTSVSHGIQVTIPTRYTLMLFCVRMFNVFWSSPRCCLPADCCLWTVHRSVTRAGTPVWLSTLEENNKESMTSGFMVSKNTSIAMLPVWVIKQ